MIFSSVLVDEERFYFQPAIELTPYFEDGLWVVKDKDLRILSAAETFETLAIEIEQQLAFLVKEYALESVDALAPDALALRKRLRTRLGMV